MVKKKSAYEGVKHHQCPLANFISPAVIVTGKVFSEGGMGQL
jgi:hypothetical protein